MRRFLLPILIAFACTKLRHDIHPARPQAGGPRVRATVVTIETVLQPANRTMHHILVFTADRARSSDEVDGWRLFDLKKNQVTFVDDVARTYRTESIDALAAKKRAAVARPLPDGTPRARFAMTSATKPVIGVATRQAVVQLGGYKRELWMAEQSAIPPSLFGMMEASRPAASKFAGITKDVDGALLSLRGFPFADHAEMVYGNKKLVIDQTVVKIEQRDVLAGWLNVDPSYKNLITNH